MKKVGPTLYLLAHAIVAFLCGAITGLPIVYAAGFLFLIAAFFAYRLLNEDEPDKQGVPAGRRAPAAPQKQAEQPGQGAGDTPAVNEDELAEQVERQHRTV